MLSIVTPLYGKQINPVMCGDSSITINKSWQGGRNEEEENEE